MIAKTFSTFSSSACTSCFRLFHFRSSVDLIVELDPPLWWMGMQRDLLPVFIIIVYLYKLVGQVFVRSLISITAASKNIFSTMKNNRSCHREQERYLYNTSTPPCVLFMVEDKITLFLLNGFLSLWYFFQPYSVALLNSFIVSNWCSLTMSDNKYLSPFKVLFKVLLFIGSFQARI